MKEYHKIETLYKRDMDGTKKLIIGDFRNPAIEMIKDCKWIGKEKIDGTNIRVYWDGHKVQFNGRTDKANLHGHHVDYLRNTFCTPEAEQIFEENFGDKEVFLFGEGYGAGIQKCGALYRPDKAFILFDVCVNNMYLPMGAIEEIATAFNILPVKVLKTGTINELVEFVKSKPTSECSIEQQVVEGIVASPHIELRDQYGQRMVVKIKVADFN